MRRVHFVFIALSTICRRPLAGRSVTTERAEVTCKQCLAKLAAAAARVAARAEASR